MYQFPLVSNIDFWKNNFEHCSQRIKFLYFISQIKVPFWNLINKKMAFHISNIRLFAFLENASGHSLQGNPFSHTRNVKSNSQDMGV